MRATMRFKKLIVGVAVLAAPVYAAAQSADQLIQKYTPLVVKSSCAATTDNAKALVQGLRDGTEVVMKMEVVAPPPPPSPAPPPFFAPPPPPPPGAMLDTTPTTTTASIDDSASTGSTATACVTEDVKFTPRTGRMGLGNVDNALTLARGMLKNVNIVPGTANSSEQRNATPAEVKAALMGGDVTTPQSTKITLPGILELRYRGNGWGEIAQQVGVSLNY